MAMESWFSVPIYVEDLPGGAALCEQLLPFLYKLSEGRVKHQPMVTGNSYSGSNSPDLAQYLFRFPEMQPLYSLINDRASRYAHELGIDTTRENLFLGRSWVNILGQGGRIEPHNHMATIFSGAFYLKVPQQGMVLRFTDPKQAVRKDPIYVGRGTPFNLGSVDYPVVPGRLILFPGYLMHGMIEPNPSDALRVSMSVDYYSVSLSGQSAPPPPRHVAERLWKQLDDEMAELRRTTLGEEPG